MPKLLRIRYADIGNKKVRMDDLIIDLRGTDKPAADTLIWLDNGFGKTTLVNLFFSMIRPNAREFVGAQLDQRRLEDYIGPHDHSVIAAEWLLDEEGEDGGPFGEIPRRVTGVFIERASGPDDDALKRLFFTFRVIPGQEEFTFEGLPLYGEEGGRRHRLTMAGFRRRMAKADEACPAAEWFETQVQREWLEQLDAVGLDSELFQYQIRMNMREGMADQLFRFRDSEEFVDFFLQMVLDPELGIRVANAIGTYRKELYDRRALYIPEQNLVEGLVTHFRGLREVARDRTGLAARFRRIGSNLGALRNFVQRQLETHREDAQKWREMALEAGQNVQRLEEEIRRRRARWAGIQLRHAEIQHEHARAAHLEAEKRLKDAQRTQQMWRAAVPLARALSAEQRVRFLQEEIRTAIESARPLYEAACEAGGRYAATLLHERLSLEAQVQELEAKSAKYENDAEAQRRIAQEKDNFAATARAELKVARERLAEANRNVQHLVKLGALTEGEEVAAARRRLEIRFGELYTQQQEQQQAIPVLEEEANRLAEISRAAHKEAEEAARAYEEARAQLERAEEEKKEIESSPRLLECLELREDSLDLDVMPDEALARLRSEIETAEHRTYQVHVRRAQGSRAVDHLERAGLLPPSVEVENVIAVLRDHVSMAVSGWEWAARSLSRNRGEQRAFIERAPALAAGVIVRDEDYERACEVLRNAKLDLDAPVVVAPQGALQSATPIGFVVGPTTDAHFDRGAAMDELERRKKLISALQSEIEKLKAWLDEVRELSWRITAFRKRYPAGWFRAQREKVDRAGEWAQHQKTRAEEAEAKARSAVQEAEDARVRLQEIERQIWRTEQLLVHVRRHIDQFGESTAPIRERIRDLEGQIDAANAARQKAFEEAERLLTLARQAREATRPLNQRIGEVEALRREIDFLPEGEIQPTPGDPATLGQEFRYRRAVYKNEVNEEGRRQLLENAQAEANDARARFRELAASADASEEEVLGLMRASGIPVDAPNAAERARDAFEDSLDTPRRIVQQTQQELDAAGARLAAARDEARKLAAPAIEPDPSITDVSAWLESEASEIHTLQQKVNGYNNERQQAEQYAQEAEREADSYKKDLMSIDGIQQDHDLDLSLVAPDGWIEPRSSNEVTDRLEAIRHELNDVKKQANSLDRKRERLVEEIRRWIDDERFADIAANHAMVRNLRVRMPEAYERDAEMLLDELEHRLQKLREVIADVDRHRETLAEQLLQAAERGIQALQAAERQSTLPVSMRVFGGKSFLRISLKPPVDTDARRERMATLIDELARDGKIPAGPELLQLAVRRLAQPIRVMVLFPDPVRQSDYRPVELLGADSGGEKLTCAVLLYCTLARMRARNRGQRVSRSSVLILDNPLGTASRGSFIELQRAVAEAAGIQLVYTTGIKDIDAISYFPMVNRLCPRIDRTTGEYVVERESVMTGLEMAKLYRVAQKAAASA